MNQLNSDMKRSLETRPRHVSQDGHEKSKSKTHWLNGWMDGWLIVIIGNQRLIRASERVSGWALSKVKKTKNRKKEALGNEKVEEKRLWEAMIERAKSFKLRWLWLELFVCLYLSELACSLARSIALINWGPTSRPILKGQRASERTSEQRRRRRTN